MEANYCKSDFTERQKGMIEFSMKFSAEAHKVAEDDFDRLKAHGFEEEDAWDFAAVAAFFGLSNRLANVASMRPTLEFYALGR